MGGGASVATYNIARQLLKLGHRVDILTSKIKGQKSKEDIEGITVYRVTSFRRSIHNCGYFGAFSFVFFAAFKFILLTRKNNYDVLTYFFSLPTGALSLLPGRHRKIPYIVYLRGSDVPMYDLCNKSLQLFHKILTPVTKYIWNRATQVIALSESLKETAINFHPDIEIKVIPNGVEADIFFPREKVKPIHNKLNIITVARLIKRKGIQDLLKALSELRNDNGYSKNFSLLVVGKGSYESQLKNLCKQLNLEDMVTFYGFCPRCDLPELYRNSDIFVLPSMAESFGIVFAEAMACGLPVICTKVGAIPDLIEDRNGILTESNNVEALKQAISYMMKHKEKWSSMGRASRDKICKEYSWEGVAKKYLAACAMK